MRAERTRYTVPGWGVGELWTSRDAVLAHEFRFEDERALATPHGDSAAADAARSAALIATRSAAPSAAPREGAGSPPTGTVPAITAPLGHGFVPSSRHAAPHGNGLDPDGLVDRLAAFLAGSDAPLDDVPLDLGECTGFQRAVAASLRSVPRGEVVSYGELAALAGYAGAQRAVGTFCARNRFAFLLPCHRVVAAEGIGGYGSAGIAVKRRLLELEGVVL